MNSQPEIRVAEIGFTVISNPPNADIDVVFVHGLGGHPRKTWTYSSSDRGVLRPKRSFFKRNPGIEPATITKEVFWPADVLAHDPRFAAARILTWGYDSHVMGFFSASNQQNISRHGSDLMVQLQQERKSDPKRPLIFVAHSLGGVLTKVALIDSEKAHHQPQFLDIYRSTLSIIFLGTPHRGSDAAGWAQIAISLARLALQNPNEKLLQGLSTNSELLERFATEFIQILEDGKFKIHSFYETKPMLGMKHEIVSYQSATMGHARFETIAAINGNHNEICKFSSAEHGGYKLVSGAIEDYLQEATIKTRSGKLEKVGIEVRKGLRDLSPDLYRAVQKHQTGIVRFLLDAGANVDFENPDDSHNHTLHIAAKHEKDAILSMLLSTKPELEVYSDQGLTPLMVAAIHGHHAVSVKFIKAGADIEARLRDTSRQPSDDRIDIENVVTVGSTALFLAAQNGQDEIVAELLKRGAKVAVSCQRGFTPLIVASMRGFSGIVQQLLKYGANTEVRTKDGFTALIYTATYNQVEVARVLLEHGADVDARKSLGMTALLEACLYEKDDIVDLVLLHGADVDGRADRLYDMASPGPLHIVAHRPSHTWKTTVEILIKKGADPSSKTDEGETAADIARRIGRLSLAKYLDKRTQKVSGDSQEATK